MGRWYGESCQPCQDFCQKTCCSNCFNVASFFSEMVGMFIFTFISSNTIASVVFSKPEKINFSGNLSTETQITFDTTSVLYINLGIAFGYTFGLYVTTQNVGYLNSAIGQVFAIMNKEHHEIFTYIFAQCCGAFLASCLTYALYFDKFTSSSTSIIFCSSLNDDSNSGFAVFDQILKSALFTVVLLAIIDDQKKKSKPKRSSTSIPQERVYRTVVSSKSNEPLLIGVALFTIGNAFTVHTRFYFNPLQDLMGRLFAIAIFGWDVLGSNWMIIITFFVPFVGSFIGMLIYITFVEINYEVDHSRTSEHAA